MLKNFLSIFKRDFSALFAAQFSGAFNDNLSRAAFSAFITYKIAGLGAGRETFFTVAALAVYMAPFFIFSVLAGEIADKFSKTKTIQIIKLTEVFTVFLIALGFWLQSPWLLLFVLFVMGAQAAFFGPVKYSILPQILAKNRLISANAVMESGRYLAIALGTLAGIFFMAGASTRAACIITALVAAGGYALTFLFAPQKPAAPQLRITPNIFKSTWKNLLFIGRNEKILLCCMGIAWFWALGAVMLSQLPELSENVLRGSPRIFNYLLILFTCGIGCGAYMCRKLLKGDISVKYIPLSALLMSCALADLAFVILNIRTGLEVMDFKNFIATFTGIRISFDLFLIALCGGLYIVPLNAMLQTMGRAQMRSRVIAVSNFINALFMVAGAAVSFALLRLGAGAPAVVGLLAISNLVVAVYILRLLPDYALRSALFFVLKALYDVKVKGLENYQNAPRRTVIIANNNSFLDPLILAAFLPDDLTFVIDSTIAKRFWVRKFLRFIKHIAVDHANPMAVKTIIEEIKKGRRIVLYPEGRISTTGGLMKIYPGPAMIADRSGAAVLPVCMQGTQYSRFAFYGRKLRHIPDVPFTVNIMPPVKLDVPDNLKGKTRRYRAEDKVYDLMTEMKFKSSDYRLTLFRSLIDAAGFAGRGSRALEDTGRKGMTFGTMLTGCFLLGRQFEKFTEKGEYAGLLLPNSNACAVTIFALMAYGRVPAIINFSSGIKNILSACVSANIKTMITARAFLEKGGDLVAEIIKALEAAGIKIVYLEDISKRVKLIDKLRALAQGLLPYRAYAAIEPAPDPDAPAVVLFTSGSEGTPKGVVLSHANINANRLQLSSMIFFGIQDKFFNALPMFHSFGLVCGLFMPLLNGAGVFLYPTPLHYKIIPELVYDRNATVFFATDTFFNAYAKAAHPYDFYNIRIVGVGGEKLKDETFKLWSEKFGIRVLEAYGATEMSPGIAFTTPMYFKRGTVGRIFPGLEYKLEPVPGVSAGGKLVLKGPNVMLGYLREDKPGLIQPVKDGWYDTGDIINIDEEGFITIVGRAKRFAKIAGEMISLGAVEGALLKLWPGDMHAIVRLPDEKRGEQLCLYTTRKSADMKSIQDYFKQEGLPELWVPRRLEFIEAMPLMVNGKVDYVRLEEAARGGPDKD
ncbi:MAG: acyl-[ACP]--phospholipid O-acyltransferase [Elusimicrobiota bacterium]|jgi:acyl-[acyl-carrier-protein]-phospholipid O-acyltransferase/long-chain-fatty-acid--[acyl-carrier-protein] ligase|nr:acyl-[ACP]--phospholipid O-acyltransferase [Elusimicrobiota bacterium]